VDVSSTLKDAGLRYEGKQPVRHMAEVLIEDLGYDELKKLVKKPLEGSEIDGACQITRMFPADRYPEFDPPFPRRVLAFGV